MSAYLARVGEWKAPVLLGVVSSPTMRRDGSILQIPGYDAASRLLYEPGGVTFPPVPDAASFEEARAALAQLLGPFRDFPFATDADRAVLACAVLTALIRRNLPSAPMFAIDAPTAGSGKSLLSETIGIIATGHKPTMMSQGKSSEEDEKRLSSVLMAGDAVIVIDNCDRPLQGDTLCTALTQEFISARILGRSEMSRMPTNALIVATGNNLEVIGDLGRRTLICRLDTGEERPDQLEYKFDPRKEALEHRPALVVAGLTILRAYLAAGRPANVPPLGSFEDWNLVRQAVIWLGLTDPATTRERIIADDPRKGELSELLQLWETAVGGQPVTLSELHLRFGTNPNSPVGRLVQELTSHTVRGIWNVRSVGRYLAKQKDRVADRRVLRADDDPSGVKRYRVERHPPDTSSPNSTWSTDDSPF